MGNFKKKGNRDRGIMSTFGKKKRKPVEIATPPKPTPPPRNVDMDKEESSGEEDDKEILALKSLDRFECKSLSN